MGMSNLPLSQQSLPVRATPTIYVTTTLSDGLPHICTDGAIKPWLAGVMRSARREPFARSFTRGRHILQQTPLTSGSIVFANNYLSSECHLQEIVCANYLSHHFGSRSIYPMGKWNCTSLVLMPIAPGLPRLRISKAYPIRRNVQRNGFIRTVVGVRAIAARYCSGGP